MVAKLREDNMPEKETLELRASTAEVEDERFVVRVKIFNPQPRTLYAYGSQRRMLYDNNTGKLTLHFHDQHVQEESSAAHHLPVPTFVPLEENKETEIVISLPKVMNRFRSAAERGGSGPLTEQLRVSEAKEVELEIAYHDTPFYYNPKDAIAKQLKEWGCTFVSVNFKLKQPERKP
jgi:hypothetical protein